MNDFVPNILASLIALKPVSYITRIGIAAIAFGAALDPDRVVIRAIGMVGLIVTGSALLVVGIPHGTAIDIVLGFSFIVAAAYSWWFNRT